MLIKSLTGREIPPRALPMDVKVVVQNVSTSFAIFEAVRYGKPLVDRVVAVTGEGIEDGDSSGLGLRSAHEEPPVE